MAVAGSKGGIYRGPYDLGGYAIPAVRYWREVGAKRLSGLELYHELRQQAHLMQVEVGIGNTCGLRCAHCFLGYDSRLMESPLVPLHRLIEVSKELVEELGTRIFCVTDRDALTPHRSVPFFEHLAALRRQEPALKFGGVTNGLALHLYADDLSRIRLDFLDISIDGLSPVHDAMRGTGTFQRTIANLRLALDRQVAERVIISPTLTRGNADSLLELIPYLILDLGVQWVDIGPLMAVKLQEFQLRETDLVHFLNRLTRTLKGLNVSHPITVLVEICAYCAAFIPALINLGWLIPEELRQDSYGHLYQDIHINNMITITLRPELIPEYWRHTVRITADGFMVGGCEPLTQREYHRFAVGNIKEEPLKMLYRKALAPGSPFYQMMLAFDRSECRNKACFAHCLGGDALLAHVAYGDYHRRDPNCIRDENRYRKQGVFHAV